MYRKQILSSTKSIFALYYILLFIDKWQTFVWWENDNLFIGNNILLSSVLF